MRTILILSIIFVLIRLVSNTLSKRREKKHRDTMFKRSCMKKDNDIHKTDV
ncbi:hypothetical protein ACKGJY_08435 [Hyunsoonleella sp. 2307UL5-6]|uniref:hypothetical protein n=1 Tax=Hyunsoonleella sp. 2307UL5-6 TaxID=3384768 RepID=UPI0039BC5D93